jgi:hypothetical protein
MYAVTKNYGQNLGMGFSGTKQIVRVTFDCQGQLLKSSNLRVQEVMYTSNFSVQIMLKYVENTELIFDTFMTP